jgi:uncharacterized protein YegP (UPF0339 family)
LYFSVFADAELQWGWILHDGDTRAIHQSQRRYRQKSECVAAVQDFRQNVAMAAILDNRQHRSQSDTNPGAESKK